MKKNIRIDLILIYYIIAVVLSMFFRVPRLNPGWYASLPDYPNGWILYSLLRASGPFVGGLIAIWFFRNKYQQTISLAGNQPVISLIYFFIPVIMIALMGIPGNSGDNNHVHGLLTGVVLMTYCLFEETGWRGFLMDAMRGISNPFRFIIIGTLWYLWHLNFISAQDAASLKFGLLVHLPSCILGSWIIGLMADKYSSLMVAAAIHSVFNIFFDLGTDMKSKVIIAVGVFSVWIIGSKIVERNQKTNETIEPNK